MELFQQRPMVEAIMRENERKFHQTEGCGQLQSGRLLRDIGVMANGQTTDRILNGTYNIPHGTTSATRSFIKKMANRS